VTRAHGRLSPELTVGAVFVATMFMSIMDVTVVNVAIPTIARQLHVGNSSVQWTVTGYLLSLAVWIPASAWLGDRFGTRRVLLIAIGVFTLGSATCALAQSMTELTAARVLQGVGGGMLQPVGMTMLFRAFPPERRARASQILLVPTAVAPAVGPIVGGLLVQNASWRWVFLINVPVGLAALVFGVLFLEPQEEHPAGRLDLWGVVLGGPGLALVLYGVTQGPVDGWTSAPVIGTAVGGVAVLAALVLVELRAPEPMLDFGLLRNRLFLDCTVTGVLGFGAFLGTLFVVPLYLQESRHFSALTSGLTTFPEALGVLASTQIAGRLYPRIGPRRMQMAGLVWDAGVLVAASVVFGAGTSLWIVRLVMFGMGTGIAYILISQQAARFATISPADTGRASAMATAVMQATSALSVALLTTVLVARAGPGVLPRPGDFRPVLLVAAGMAVLGALLAVRIRDADAAATMGRGLMPPDGDAQTVTSGAVMGAGSDAR
jgi:EmrB/QacA subfamily drug resistance transporter